MKYYGNRFICILLALIFAFSALTVYAYSENIPSVSARAAALYEPESESFIYKKNIKLKLPMASTTKIMTALIVLENLPLDKEIEVDERAIGTDGSSIYLERGEVMSTEALLYSLMLGSANDAAEALAYEISGSIDAFSLLMNEKAAAIGATDTQFKNPHGLDATDHYTTAHDLALISAEALKNAKFKEIASTYKKEVTSNIKTRLVVNHNKLLKMYDGCIGVKTGYTQLSGRSLVGAAVRDGLTLISVTIDAPDDWSDHKKLFDYGFKNMHCEVLLEKAEFKRAIPVLSGEKQQISVENSKEIKIIYNRERPKISKEIRLDRYILAPINEGDTIGKIIYKDGERILGESPIVATEQVDTVKKKSFFERIFG